MTTHLLRLQTRDQSSPSFERLGPDWLTQDNVNFERRMRRHVKKRFDTCAFMCAFAYVCF